jgi:hypothetical protein
MQGLRTPGAPSSPSFPPSIQAGALLSIQDRKALLKRKLRPSEGRQQAGEPTRLHMSAQQHQPILAGSGGLAVQPAAGPEGVHKAFIMGHAGAAAAPATNPATDHASQ